MGSPRSCNVLWRICVRYLRPSRLGAQQRRPHISPMTIEASHLFVAVLPLFLLWLAYRRHKPSLPLPPGPPGLPVIGSLLDIPHNREWLTFKDWSSKYNSDVIHYTILGTSIVVVNSRAAAYDLLEKKSSIYSDRPRMLMLNELSGFDWNFGFMPYGQLWKDHRRVFQREFNPSAYLRQRPHQYAAACKLLHSLLDTPNNWMGHLRFLVSSLVMSLGYGIEIQSDRDPYVEIAERSLPAQSTAGISARFLVDLIPILKYLPSWFPGADFHRQAKEWRKYTTAMPEVAYVAAKKSVAEGAAKPSIVSRLLERINDNEDREYQEMLVRGSVGVMYAAASDTTVSVLGTFVLAMTLYPEVQKKAQQAVDAVTKGDRILGFSDYATIPYIDALVKETHRWRPVNPLALPHRLMEEDVYKGYRIPAGSVVFGNTWAMQQDPSTFPEPECFNPDRFLNPDGTLNESLAKDVDVAFGYGRRACAGKDMANALTWLVMSMILSAFDIEKAVDQHGMVIEPPGDYFYGMLCFPKEFRCAIKPRSAKAEALIKALPT